MEENLPVSSIESLEGRIRAIQKTLKEGRFIHCFLQHGSSNFHAPEEFVLKEDFPTGINNIVFPKGLNKLALILELEEKKGQLNQLKITVETQPDESHKSPS